MKQEPPNILPYSLDINPDDPQVQRSFRNAERRLWTPTLINLPAALVVLPYVIHNPTKTDWVPYGMDFKRWRAISWPFIGLIFWWMAGRGVEALLASRRSVIHPGMGWIGTGVSAVLTVWGLIILILPLCAGNSDIDLPWILICGSGALRAALGGAIVLARIAQDRIRVRLRDAKAPEALAS